MNSPRFHSLPHPLPFRLGLAACAFLAGSLALEFWGEGLVTLVASGAVVVSAGLSGLGCILMGILRLRKSRMLHPRVSVILNLASLLVSCGLVLFFALILQEVFQIDWQRFGDQIGR